MAHSSPRVSIRLSLQSVLLLLCLVLVPRVASATDATIGLYYDETGQSCSFAGNASGQLSAYVIVTPGTSGVLGVRFSAPIPTCFDATFISETVPQDVVSLGSSQTGISISSRFCETDPFQVLQITYMSTGGTLPCCSYPIVADPFTGLLEAVDCAFESTPISSVLSRFNADSTCVCGGTVPVYEPPSAPFDPIPGDEAQFISVSTDLRWNCFDPNGLGVTCDVYFGTNSDPPLVASDVPSAGATIYPPGRLDEWTTYYWRVVVRNSALLETSGPVWHFRTNGANSFPVVTHLSPSNGALTVSVTPTLRWHATDPDGDDMTYDLYLGTTAWPPLVASGLTLESFTPSVPLEYSTTYWWRVVAIDSEGHNSSSVNWSFITKAENEPPGRPTVVSPPNGSTVASLTPTLTWAPVNDPEGQPVHYDVYFGPVPPPPPTANIGIYVDSFGSTCSFSGNSPRLVNAYVVVRPGPQPWHEVFFKVAAPSCWDATYLGERAMPNMGWNGTSQDGISIGLLPPTTCSAEPTAVLQISYLSRGSTPCCAFSLLPHPAYAAVKARNCNNQDLPITPITSYINADSLCECEGVVDLPRVAEHLTQTSYAPGTLQMQVKYQWRVVARDAGGLEQSSPYWSFTTRAGQPPVVPYSPSPADGAVNRAINTTLSWQSSDPEGEPVKYDVYFGTAASPPLVATNVTTKSYNPGLQLFSTTYRWRIVARDAAGMTSTGPTWSYTTRPQSLPPMAPIWRSPANGSSNVPVNTALAWQALDPDNDPLVYDVYFGAADASVPGAGASIGLYTDAGGSTCTFSGNPSGLIDAYVIVKPAGIGISGVRFSVPVPNCFGGNYLYSTVPPNMLALGDAQADISITSGACLSQPFQVLQVTYMGDGNTTPCCEYPLSPSVFTGALEAVDCNHEDTPIHTIQSRFNAGAACPCNQGVLPRVAQNIAVATFAPGLLDVSTRYGWRVVARDPSGLETVGQTWSFTTSADPNQSPLAPSNPSPADQAMVDDDSPVLRWQSSDPDGDSMSYTIFVFSDYGIHAFGNTSVPQFSLEDLQPYRMYRWTVEVYDGHWRTQGPEWSFMVLGPGVPVRFAQFVATPQPGGIEIRWELSSDEDLDQFVVYRREASRDPLKMLKQGDVTATTGVHIDSSAKPGSSYEYQLMVRTRDGTEFRSPFAKASMPALELTLHQNQPNPFNPQTTIRYDLPAGEGGVRVRLFVVDLSGRRVRMLVDEVQRAGSRSAVWNGRDDSGEEVASGVYFCVLDAGKQRLTRKLVLLK